MALSKRIHQSMEQIQQVETENFNLKQQLDIAERRYDTAAHEFAALRDQNEMLEEALAVAKNGKEKQWKSLSRK